MLRRTTKGKENFVIFVAFVIFVRAVASARLMC
jgi:hypothetical protein